MFTVQIVYILAASILIGLLFYITPFALHNALGLTGFFVGIGTVAMLFLEGGPGPLTQLIAFLACLALGVYVLQELSIYLGT